MTKQAPAKTQADFFFPAVMQDTRLQFSWDLKCNGICIHYLRPRGEALEHVPQLTVVHVF